VANKSNCLTIIKEAMKDKPNKTLGKVVNAQTGNEEFLSTNDFNLMLLRSNLLRQYVKQKGEKIAIFP